MALQVKYYYLLHFIEKYSKPQRDAMTCPQVSGLGLYEGPFGSKSCLVFFVCFFFCCTMFLPHLDWWILGSIRGGTKSFSPYLTIVFPDPNTVLGIEKIFNNYLLNEFLFPGPFQTYGCNSIVHVPSFLAASLVRPLCRGVNYI